jgi:molecular chaperone DnaJ
VQVEVRPDRRFLRDGLDVLHRVAVPVTDAMVGTTLTVPTVYGDQEIELRPGTQSGEEVVLRGQGFPAIQGRGKGDQRVVVEVRVPRVTTEEGRRAVTQLGETLTDKSYREDEGFFDRIKHAFR